MSPQDALRLVSCRPTSLNDDLYQWSSDASDAICELAKDVILLRSALEKTKGFIHKSLRERDFADKALEATKEANTC